MGEQREMQALCAPAVFTGEQLQQDHCVLLQDGSIVDVMPTRHCPKDCERIELPFGTLAPGLVDLQVNGGGDVLFNQDPTPEGIAAIATAHRALGTTSLLPTVISDTPQVMAAAADSVQHCIAAGHPGILGIHIEGPFFEPARRGAHSEHHVRPANTEDIDWLCSIAQVPRLITLAPENVSPEAIARLAASGAIVCAGHTNATRSQLAAAINAGLQGVTHLYNAMSSITAREPGTVGTTLADDRLWAGIIADGHHVNGDNIRIALRAKPAGKLILVSDAMATVGGNLKSFQLYDEEITEVEGKLLNATGVLAGSAICLMDAVRFTVSKLRVSLEECLRMASLYPATIVGRGDTLGRLASGYRADLVHFDENLVARNTWLAGHRLVSQPL